MSNRSLSDQIARSGLESVYDAVHGSIDVRDAPGCETNGVIVRLLSSPMVDRLRRIEQLSFASQQFIAADHSRYAHALGTMHMMRLIVRRLVSRRAPPFDDLSVLRDCFPDTFARISEDVLIGRLTQHLLVAALVQDVGELPYNMASIQVCTPSEQLRRDVGDWSGLKTTSGWTGKEIFTVGCLSELWKHDIPEKLDSEFLVFLVTGESKSVPAGKLKPFRFMLDGVVDADRLDYVFRDGHHTVGKLGGPDAVIDTMLGFDVDGPIFSDPGPVSQFLAARAHLYSTVYLSPTNRFRVVVLTDLLKGIADTPECAEIVFERNGGQQLRISEFGALDDVTLSARIRQLDQKRKGALPSRAQIALDIFVKGEPKYRPVWLPASGSTADEQQTEVPQELFWDTLSDVGGELYAQNAVRVQNAQFQYYNRIQGQQDDAPVALERCGGPFSLIAKQKAFMLPAPVETSANPSQSARQHVPSLRPMPGCILLFEPEEKNSGHWEEFERGLKDGRSYRFLMGNDPLTPHGVAMDTWGNSSFKPPKIFISYARPDKAVVRKIINSLHKQRRQYCALAAGFQDVGLAPTDNILSRIRSAEAVILVVSQEYSRAYEDVGRHVHKEVDLMERERNRLILVPLAADPFPTVQQAPFLKALSITDEVPWMGEKDLRELPTPDVDRAIEAVLKFIDMEIEKKAI